MTQKPQGIWQIGTYWHLKTRPDEFDLIDDKNLKGVASKIDQLLNGATCQTFVHGDAKLANFCFRVERLAAVDFQSVGGDCSIKMSSIS